MNTPARLSDYIDISRRFQRSINLVRDREKVDVLDGYLVTPHVQHVLLALSESFEIGSAERAYTLTGPYGSGKSAFVLFFTRLLESAENRAWEMLRTANHNLAERLHRQIYGDTGQKGYLVLPITARRAAISDLLADALDTLTTEIDLTPVEADIDSLPSCNDAKTLVRIFTDLVAVATSQGYRGITVIIDEFGKVFEAAFHDQKRADVHVLQELAEAACRSGDTPFIFIGALHQSFGNYAEGAELRIRNDFNKIQGRFRDIAFVETAAAQMRMMASAITHHADLPREALANISVDLAGADKHALYLAAGFNVQEFAGIAEQAWPIHPLSLLALPFLFKRFAQNERSIFNYLNSNEEQGFQHFLKSQAVSPANVVRLSDIYDYFMSNFQMQLARHPQAKLLFEADDLLRSRASLTDPHGMIIKTVAMLNALGAQSHIKSNAEMIAYAVGEATVNKTLEFLCKRSILVHRNFDDTYRIWEGSDIDLPECLQEAERSINRGEAQSIEDLLGKYLPPQPLVARRHSFETGALRSFEVVYADNPDTLQKQAGSRMSPGTVGKAIIALPGSHSLTETFMREAARVTEGKPNLLVAVPADIEDLRGSLHELACLKWVQENKQELRDDKVARIQVAMWLAEATDRVVQRQDSLVDPRSSPAGCGCHWFWKGEDRQLTTPVAVSRFLSEICDDIYDKSPAVRNELISRRQISSMAAAARNTLIKRMIHPKTNTQENLGITGFPPERSIYESLLLASGIHTSSEGSWYFSRPAQNAVNLLPCWEKMEQIIFDSGIQRVTLRTLFEQLANPPYGLLDGVHPILFTAFYMVNHDELSLYFEKNLIPDPQDAHFELLVRRPELFEIAGARIDGARQAVVARLASGFGVEAKVVPVTRYFYRMMGSISAYAMNSSQVSHETAQLRQAFRDAKSPELLLFADLPKAFGMRELGADTVDDELIEQFFTQLNRCLTELQVMLPNMVHTQRALFMEACRLPDTSDGWQVLYTRAAFLASRVTNPELLPLLRNVINTGGDINKADAVIGYLVGRPPENWGNLELSRYPTVARGKAELFIQTWRGYDQVTGNEPLNPTEQAQADALRHQFAALLQSQTDQKVIRAALLAYLEELQQKDEA